MTGCAAPLRRAGKTIASTVFRVTPGNKPISNCNGQTGPL